MSNRRVIDAGMILVCVFAGACHRSPEPTVSAATTADASAPVLKPNPAADVMAHGDHNPHHGGIVYMYDDMHYEVVLDPGGHHRVYFTDSTREDLPASVASTVTLTIEGPQHAAEKLTGTIDPQGESWELNGSPVTGSDTNVRVAFVAKGDQYWIDVPFIPSTR
jgi:hypothetical protein